MSITDNGPLSRRRLRNVFEQLANDRKLAILRYTHDHGSFTVADLKSDLGIPHTTAHAYCRELRTAGLLAREQSKPARYTAVDFDLHLSLDAVAAVSKRLDLTYFEVANTLYRIAAHEQCLSRDVADLLVAQLADLRSEIDVLSLQDAGGIDRVYETAWATSLTVYDASYVAAAEATGLTLVTTDIGIHDHTAEIEVAGVDILR